MIATEGKPAYIRALEAADEGDQKAFSDYVGVRSTETILSAVQIGRDALAGRLNRANGNGGRTVGDVYFPPEPDPDAEPDASSGARSDQ